MDAYLGELRIFAGDYAPRGWAFCHGQTLPISQNQALYALLGTIWGGDGINSFALPDLRGRLVVGSGHGPGLTARTLGEVVGESTVLLGKQQLPAHTHHLAASDQNATSDTPTNESALFATAFSPDAASDKEGLPYLNDTSYVDPQDGKTKQREPQVLAIDTVTEAGGASPHNNAMPTLSINYIIALTGNFPSQ
ncbi:phage tail protein [Ancylobacter sp. IITR112]|uniref:phage tail protein n=1 Tax=Ancylobacter sp. IITR112 TaxID=3138073 RepID=UPI00352B608B